MSETEPQAEIERFGRLYVASSQVSHAVVRSRSREELLREVVRVLVEMLESGKSPTEIISARGLQQISDGDAITQMIKKALDNNPAEVKNYLAGKESLANWFFGQVMRQAGGKANPQVVRAELERQLSVLKKQQS